MLPFPLPEITEVVLKQICLEQWPETQTLEFKAKLPLNDETAKHEFRKDVCALANAEGGDLVYGIGENSGCANAIDPIVDSDFDAVQRRLKQILESMVEPRIHNIRFHRCTLAAGGFVVILRIPSSYDGPHRFGLAPAHRFAIRIDTSTSDMTYDQLRNAFGRSETLHQKAAQFRAARVDMIVADQTPRVMKFGVRLIVHIIPLCGLAGRAKVDIAALQAAHDIFRMDASTSWKRIANLAGLKLHPPYEVNSGATYAQIFRNGAFEYVENVSQESQGQDKFIVDGNYVGTELRNCLNVYAKGAIQLGVEGQAVVCISLAYTNGSLLLLRGNSLSRDLTEGGGKIDLPEVMVADIAGVLNLDEITQPILDVLYQCFGQHSCNLYDATGRWNGQT